MQISLKKVATNHNLDSPLTSDINNAVLKFYTDGTLKILTEKWFSNQDGNCNKEVFNILS